VRFSDLPRLALLQFPVRCRLCRERFHVGMSLALHMLQAEKVRAIKDAEMQREEYKNNSKTRA